MADCSLCGDGDGFGYTCKYCGRTFCSDHRIPEKHNCPNKDAASSPDVRAPVNQSTSVPTTAKSMLFSRKAVILVVLLVILAYTVLVGVPTP